VALWQDKFGSAFDAAHWTKSGLLVYYSNGAAGSAVEADDVLPIIAGPGANSEWDYGVYSDQLFTGDFDVHIDCNAITWNLDTVWQRVGLAVYSDSVGAPDTDNGILVQYLKKTGTYARHSGSIVAGVATWSALVNVTSNSPKFRIVRSGTTITTYYDDGAGWVQETQYAGTGFGSVRVVIDADTFRTAKSVTFPINEFIQTSGGVYWDDSPEADIVDSVNIGGGESYAFDAAVEKAWVLTGASSVEDGDGGSNKWKVGFSDNADGTGVTWDAAWRTIVEVNTNAANGDYNGHRYLYVKWQGNSDSTQNVNVTSFTISGVAAAPGSDKILESTIFNSKVFAGGIF
jgi:hypothetical protein